MGVYEFEVWCGRVAGTGANKVLLGLGVWARVAWDY